MDSRYNMQGKVCIVSGANSGIGKAAALALAKSNATVIMLCRNRKRGQSALDEIINQSKNPNTRLMIADLSSQKSISTFTAEFNSQYGHLHVLINNAANFDMNLKKPQLTEDGIETIFATNHLGPFLLTNLLIEKLKASAPSRVINVASKGLVAYPFLNIEFNNLNGEKRYIAIHAYYHSKLAHVMFTYELARRLNETGVTVNCIRVPNVAVSDERLVNHSKVLQVLYRQKRRFSITIERMAESYLYLAASPDLVNVSGKYFNEHNKQVSSSRNSYNEEAWKKLWEISSMLVHLNT
jgi:NAD(P)-dependent dehydrogenase (short-subunit alcohol dehydrogenase family)